MTKDQLIIQENVDHGFGGECGNVRFDKKCYFLKLILVFCIKVLKQNKTVKIAVLSSLLTPSHFLSKLEFPLVCPVEVFWSKTYTSKQVKKSSVPEKQIPCPG